MRSSLVEGDSVAEYTPLFLKRGYRAWITTFTALADEVVWTTREDGKETAECADLLVWSDEGWTRLERLIRHGYDPAKGLVRVLTHTGLVDVTPDHSLLTPDGLPVTPGGVAVGDALLHADIPALSTDGDVITDPDRARIMGFFMGDGSCGVYDCPSGRKASWALNNSDMKMLTDYKELCERAYPELRWKILDTIGTSFVYKLVPNSDGVYGGVSRFVAEWRRMCYLGRDKIVPENIAGASLDIRQAFWEGLYDADGDKTQRYGIDQRSQLSTATIFALITSLGHRVSLNCRTDKPHIFRMTQSTKLHKPADVVKKIVPMVYDGAYVYDATTANHHFAAGPGRMVVHNTDSVMVKFKVQDPGADQDDMHAHFALATRVAAEISATFPGCIELEFEKCYRPYCLYSKKRYAGLMYTKPGAPDYIDVKGLQLVRRDSPPIVKTVSNQILDAIMHARSTDKALAAARAAVLDVLAGRRPIDDFVTSKSLRGSYANPNAQPHVVVARKIKERTGESLGSGVRVPYVFVVDNAIDGNVSTRAEDPGYVRAHPDVQLDYLYYVDQLMSPIKALLEVMVDDPVVAVLGAAEIAGVLGGMRASRTVLVREVKRVKTNVKNKQHEITNFFSAAK